MVFKNSGRVHNGHGNDGNIAFFGDLEAAFMESYVAKKEMLKWPLLNIWMKDLHCLFLDRQDIKAGLKTILAAIDKVKNGISICRWPFLFWENGLQK